MTFTGWTDAHEPILRSMWAEGQSARAIAEAIGGVSRSAVISKLRRLKLGGRCGRTGAHAGGEANANRWREIRVAQKLSWSAEMIGQLRQMHDAGAKPAEIANVLGCSRDAVKGRLRLIREGRDGITKPVEPRERQPTKKRIRTKPVAPTRPKIEPPGQDAVRLMQLTGRTCRWPVGEATRAAQMFCGAPPEPGRPYCTRHCLIGFEMPRSAA